jgi:hypothetical protein
MIERLQTDSPKILAFRLSGKLHDADYKTFVPAVEAAIDAEGKIRMLAAFHDFHGWDLHAVWDDIKFSTKHCTDIERIALVGDRKWEEDSLLRCVGGCRRSNLAGRTGIVSSITQSRGHGLSRAAAEYLKWRILSDVRSASTVPRIATRG